MDFRRRGIALFLLIVAGAAFRSGADNGDNIICSTPAAEDVDGTLKLVVFVDNPDAVVCSANFCCTVSGESPSYSWTFSDANPASGSEKKVENVQWTSLGESDVSVSASAVINGVTCSYSGSLPVVRVHPVFQPRNVDCLNQGFDPPLSNDPEGTLPWTSVTVGQTNSLVKLVMPEEIAPLTKLVVAEGANYIQLTSPEPDKPLPKAGETLIEIVGTSPGLDVVKEAKIELRRVTDDSKIATLMVMVLPQRTVSIGIQRVTDPMSDGTSPVNAPSNTQIRTDLDSVFKQAGVAFQVADGSGAKFVFYDNGDGKVQQNSTRDEIELIRSDLDATGGKIHLYIAKESGIPYAANPNKFVRGRTLGDEQGDYCILFADTIAEGQGDLKRVASHEVGHILGLSTAGETDRHDPGPFPPDSDPGLMVVGINAQGEVLAAPGTWLRHEDWRAANEAAAALED